MPSHRLTIWAWMRPISDTYLFAGSVFTWPTDATDQLAFGFLDRCNTNEVMDGSKTWQRIFGIWLDQARRRRM